MAERQRRNRENMTLEDLLARARRQSCLLKMKGEYRDELNWITGEGTPGGMQTVSAVNENQGPCAVCWAFPTGKAAHSAFLCAGHDHVPRLSIQDIVDHTYPGRPGCRGGSAMAALEFMKTQGVSEEGRYSDYTGIKPPQTPPLLPMDGRHRPNTWCLISDEETAMLAAAREQPLIVDLPNYSGFVLLRGKGIVDLVQASNEHDIRILEAYYEGEQLMHNTNYHTLLLVGFGTFYPENRLFDPINYWILKNQWTDEWGDGGIGYIRRNSSYYASPSTYTRYTPMIPFVAEQGAIEPEEPSDIMRNKTLRELLNYVTNRQYLRHSLLYVFYHPQYCLSKGINIEEVMSALERAYKLDYDTIIAMVDLTVRVDSYTVFNFRRDEQLVFIAFKDKFRGRTTQDGLRFPMNQRRQFTFGELLLWLGDELRMAPSPGQPYIG